MVCYNFCNNECRGVQNSSKDILRYRHWVYTSVLAHTCFSRTMLHVISRCYKQIVWPKGSTPQSLRTPLGWVTPLVERQANRSSKPLWFVWNQFDGQMIQDSCINVSQIGVNSNSKRCRCHFGELWTCTILSCWNRFNLLWGARWRIVVTYSWNYKMKLGTQQLNYL